MDNRHNPPYTYAESGFNPFMSRSIDSDPAVTLRQRSSNFRRVNTQSVNFDHAQTTGSLGSAFAIGGKIKADGAAGNIIVADESNDRIIIGDEVDGF